MRPKLHHRITATAILLATIVALLMPSTSRADTPIEFNRCRAVRASGERIQGEGGRFDGEILSFRTAKGETVEIVRDDLRLLDVGQGSKAGSYALAGAGLGALTSILAIIQVEADPEADLEGDLVLPVTAGLVGAGALIGAIVGASATSWTNVPIGPADGVSFGFDPHGVRLSLRF